MFNKEAVEIQYNSNGTVEESFRTRSKVGEELLTQALARCCQFAIDKKEIELISYAPNDDLSVKDQAIALVFNSAIRQSSHLSDYHVIKVMNNNESVLKCYDNDFWRHPNIPLPVNARLAQQFGIGFYPDNEEIDIYDMYFFHHSLEAVEDHFNLNLNLPDFVKAYGFGLYGVSYNSNLEALKLKRYFYPSDPQLNNPQDL